MLKREGIQLILKNRRRITVILLGVFIWRLAILPAGPVLAQTPDALTASQYGSSLSASAVFQPAGVSNQLQIQQWQQLVPVLGRNAWIVAWPALKKILVQAGLVAAAGGTLYLFRGQVGAGLREVLETIFRFLDYILTIVTASVVGLFTAFYEAGDSLIMGRGAAAEAFPGFSEAIKDAWGFVLGIANLIFLLALIISALALILKTTGYNLKKVIGSTLLNLILANLSYVLAVLVIALGFSLGSWVGSSQPGASAGQSGAWVGHLMNNFLVTFVDPAVESADPDTGQVEPVHWIDDYVEAKVNDGSLKKKDRGATTLMLFVLSVIVRFVIFLTILKLFLIIIERLIRLIALVIISPLAYAAALLPAAQNWVGKWWEQFIAWVLTLPVALILLAIASKILTIFTQQESFTGEGFALKRIVELLRSPSPDQTAAELLAFLAGAGSVLGLFWLAGETPKLVGAGQSWLIGQFSGFAKGIGKTALGVLGLSAAATTIGLGEALAKKGEAIEKAAGKPTWKSYLPKLAGAALQRLPAIPTATKKILAGVRKEQERKLEGGEIEFMKSATRYIPPLRKAVGSQLRDRQDKIVQGIIRKPLSQEELDQHLNKALKDEDWMDVVGEALSRMLVRGGVSKETKAMIRTGVARFIQEHPEMEELAINAANKFRWGNLYPVFREAIKQTKEANAEMFNQLGQLRLAYENAKKEAAKLLGNNSPLDLKTASAQQINQFKNQVNLYAERAKKRELITRLLTKGGAMSSEEASDLIQNTKALQLLEQLISPENQKLLNALKDKEIIKWLADLNEDTTFNKKDELKRASREGEDAIKDYLLGSSFLGQDKVDNLASLVPKILELEDQFNLFQQASTATADTKNINIIDVATSLRNDKDAYLTYLNIQQYNQLQAEVQEVQKVNPELDKWFQTVEPSSLQPIITKLSEAASGLERLRESYQDKLAKLEKIRATMAQKLNRESLKSAIQKLEEIINQWPDYKLDDTAIEELAKQLKPMLPATLTQYGREALTILGSLYHYLDLKESMETGQSQTNKLS